MKRNFQTILLLFLAVFSLSRCQTSNTQGSADSFHLNVNLENTEAEAISLSTIYGMDEAAVTDGTYAADLPTEAPTFITSYIDRNAITVFVRPGDTVRINYDADSELGPQIEGDLAKENTFLISLMDSLNAELGSPWSLYSQSEEVVMKRMADIDAYGKELFDAFLAKNPDANTGFKEMTTSLLRYYTGQYVANYPMYHGYSNPNDTTYQPSETLLTEVAALQEEKPELLNLPLYINVLKSKMSAKVNDLMENDTTLQGMEGYNIAKARALESEFSNPAVVEMMTYDNLNEYITYDGTDGIEEAYQTFMESSTNEILKERLAASYQTWAHLKKGNVAPDFNYPDIEEVMHALSDYKGKVVYIDVWATWCGPCLAEQPYLAEIEEEYKGNEDIIFMGVSIDQDKAAWETMVSEKEMSGVQIFADGAWNSSITQDYMIKGIPRFILVDMDGNLVDATAYRPSNDKLKVQLQELLDTKPVTG
jgi:thiol-disulfide isomerase/thioredoxin